VRGVASSSASGDAYRLDGQKAARAAFFFLVNLRPS
jgi:hypothetical protein